MNATIYALLNIFQITIKDIDNQKTENRNIFFLIEDFLIQLTLIKLCCFSSLNNNKNNLFVYIKFYS